MISTFAPPCSGPQRAQTAAAQLANRLQWLLPTIRQVLAEQFCSWSACSRKIRSSARAASPLTLPPPNIMARKSPV